jgi:hypothetical protein
MGHAAATDRRAVLGAGIGATLEDTWQARDLPVLNAVVSQFDEVPRTSAWPDAGDIAALTGLALTDVAASLNAFDGEYLTLVRAGTLSGWHVTNVTSAARRAVGQWLTPDALVLRLAEAFGAAAESEADPERKGRLRQVAAFLTSTGRDIATEVVSKVIVHSAGIG